MTLKEILDLCNGSTVTVGMVILLSLVQVSKIPFNPWSLLGKVLGKMIKLLGKTMNEDIYTELQAIRDRQEELSNKIDEMGSSVAEFEDKTEKDMLKTKRSRILKFYNECYRGIGHSREEFDNIIETYEDYENTIQQKGLTNGKIDNAYRYIMEDYHKNETNHSFIE